ncbi:MAG: hypothetical protein IT210_06920 [Armatimonadetes bacterium]|nr:hypothetical protein [Armatimonadota bacterium]
MPHPLPNLLTSLALIATMPMAACHAGENDMQARTDPVTRYLHIPYRVPADAPEEVRVRCSWSPSGREDWTPARVTPRVSETALRLAPRAEWERWLQGTLTERRAAGLTRAVVFNPYPEAQIEGKVNIAFRIEILRADGTPIHTQIVPVQADNSDVLYIEDWTKVVQPGAVARGSEAPASGWTWRTGLTDRKEGTFGNALFGSPHDRPLPKLTYPLDLRGVYAVFVLGDSIHMRLSGDERTDSLGMRRPYEEVFWRWKRMDRQHLILKQPHYYTGYTAAHLDYVRLVPLSEKTFRQLEGQYEGKKDKFVAGYFEPYSWAFYADFQESYQHRDPLAAFAETNLSLIDIQVGRMGMKMVYETRRADQLLHNTHGDPIGDDPSPETYNVGRMQQYSNTLETELRYAREMGMTAHANFGATACYVGTPLQGDITQKHPDWRTGDSLRYGLPEVREFILGLYREALEIGAPGISIDFCRYPDGADSADSVNIFLRQLRRLADEFAAERGERVPILIRFPARGVRLWRNFDYSTWAKEGLVDYLCPGNIQGRHHHFDIEPYRKAVRGTKVKLLPVVDGLEWGPEMPGLYLWRVEQLYRAGVPGIYIYQADGRILSWPPDRRTVRLLNSRAAVRRWWAEDARLRPQRSKGIYLTPSSYPDGYNVWERLRVWLEGVPMGEVEMYLDGKLVSHYQGPPYVLGSEENESDEIIPPGEHALRIRARDGGGWLEQTFSIRGSRS